MKRAFLSASVAVLLIVSAAPAWTAGAELHPGYYERAKQATVMLSFIVLVLEDRKEVNREYWHSGSAVVVDPEGRLLTSNHVVDPAELLVEIDNRNLEYERDQSKMRKTLVPEIMLVSLGNANPMFTARIVIPDPVNDLALLEISGNTDGIPLNAKVPLQYLERGDSDLLADQTELHLFGYPQDTDVPGLRSVPGTISGFEDQLWIDLDASGSAGFSGGPAIDRDGKLVGIITELTDSSGANPRVLLRPINLAKPLIESPLKPAWIAEPMFGPTNAWVDLLLGGGSFESSGVNNMVALGSNLDVQATFDLVNPHPMFDEDGNPLIWVLTVTMKSTSGFEPCHFLLLSLGVGFYAIGGTMTNERPPLQTLRAEKFSITAGASNTIIVQFEDSAARIFINGELSGPYSCASWTDGGWLTIGAWSSIPLWPNVAEIRNFTVWDYSNSEVSSPESNDKPASVGR